MNIGFNTRINAQTCVHAKSIVVNTVGLQRLICETCGHVSVKFTDDTSNEVRRTAFARNADELQPLEKRLVGAA